MKKFNESKCLLVMANCLFFVFLATSCTSDDFFGIEEDYDGLDYPTLVKIAHSKEYVEYQIQSISCMDLFNDIDTIHKEQFDTADSIQSISIEPFLKARNKLQKLFPEYDIASPYVKQIIFNLAINNNQLLRSLVENKMPNAFLLTKSANYESYAVQWIMALTDRELLSDSNGCTDLVCCANSMWLIDGQTWYTYDNYNCAISDAIRLTIRNYKEYGGFAWIGEYDRSGILVEDPCATDTSMHLPYIPVQTYPSFDFHIHPHGTLAASEADNASFSSKPWKKHYIFDTEGHGIRVIK